MGASLLITLREGLGVFIVLAIIVAYLVRTGRSEQIGWVWLGAGLGGASSLAGGLLFRFLIGEFTGHWEQAIEGILSLSAAVVLTWMILWMRANTRGLSGELKERIDSAGSTPRSLVSITFVAVIREGFETALFLMGAESGSSSGSQVVSGGLIGLALAAVAGLAFYRRSRYLDLRRFFRITGILLILFAAGLFAKAVHEFRELLGIEWATFVTPLWRVSSGPMAKGSPWHDFAAGLFGWSPSPERIRVAAYVAYLLPISWLFLRPDPQSHRRPQPPSEARQPVHLGRN